MIKVEQVNVSLKNTEKEIKEKVAQRLEINEKDIKNMIFLKKSIDARRKNEIHYTYNLAVELDESLENKFQDKKILLDYSILTYSKKSIQFSPIIVGFGPSGMFCALMLSRMGFKPIVIEQGKCVDEREKDVKDFWNSRLLNKYSNVQFGEGGAGTFSDGKLNSNLDNPYCKKVTNEFYHFGAPKEILYTTKAHIGSDNLKSIVKNIREEILQNGGRILFSNKFEDFETENNKIKKVTVRNLLNNETLILKTDNLILALGHSSRETFELLKLKNLEIKQKPFAIGVRIEQKQEDVNIAQYGKNYSKNLPNADYKLAVHLKNGRSVFTFCMCPGGQVVASSSSLGEIVTNGMSEFARNKENCNSALLVNVMPEDFEGADVLAGVDFQEKYEKLAFEIGGKNYNAPCETVGSFLHNKENESDICCSYRPNITFTKIEKCLPNFVSQSLKEALPLFNQKLNNFAKDENLLIAIETRTSCPITIIRDEKFESNVSGIYPIGEGAGYAGGIISSAVDGIRCAEEIYKKLY